MVARDRHPPSDVWLAITPHTPLFCAKSAEMLEKKRVEFLMSAKKRKRVRKNLKRKGIGDGI